MNRKSRLPYALAFAFLLAGAAAAQTRTATTSIGITVERHSAILLTAGGPELARLSSRREPAEAAAAIGNASPTLITVEDSAARSVAPASSAKARVAVTVFEP